MDGEDVTQHEDENEEEPANEDNTEDVQPDASEEEDGMNSEEL